MKIVFELYTTTCEIVCLNNDSIKSLVFLFVDNYKVETIPKGYEITMKLTIKSVQPQDFGSYRCVAKNSLGEMDGKIKLYSK